VISASNEILLNLSMHKVQGNYSSFTGRSCEKRNVAAVEVLRKKERQDETQCITKVAGKTSLGPRYFVL